METKTKKFTPKFIASVGILSGISVVLMQVLEFPLPFMPPFLKLDFSTLPALIGGFAYGPLTGIIIAVIKALFHLLRTSTGGVGEFADLVASIAIILTSSLIYKKNKTRKVLLSVFWQELLLLLSSAVLLTITYLFLSIQKSCHWSRFLSFAEKSIHLYTIHLHTPYTVQYHST